MYFGTSLHNNLMMKKKSESFSVNRRWIALGFKKNTYKGIRKDVINNQTCMDLSFLHTSKTCTEYEAYKTCISYLFAAIWPAHKLPLHDLWPRNVFRFGAGIVTVIILICIHFFRLKFLPLFKKKIDSAGPCFLFVLCTELLTEEKNKKSAQNWNKTMLLLPYISW